MKITRSQGHLGRTVLSVFCLVWMGSGCTRLRHPPPAVSEILLADEQHKDRILRGVYSGEGSWRWTAPSFAFALDPPSAAQATFLEMDFTVPQELIEKASNVTVVAKVNGVEVARRNYQKADRNLLACKVPPEALQRRPAEGE